MASFTLEWTPIISSNVSSQRAYYRRKSTGGTFLTTGFIPSNDLSTSDSTTVKGSLLDNVVYQFLVANICEEGGPTFDSSSATEMIVFSCAGGIDIETEMDSVTINYSNLPEDINFIKVTVNSMQVTLAVTDGEASITFPGLTPNTEYTVETVFGAILNGVQIYDTDITCSEEFTTDAAPCDEPTNLIVSGQQPNLIWIEDESVCETSGGFSIYKTITGASSPSKVWLDTTTNRTYIADQDNPLGNVYWFDHNTATTIGDFTYSAAVVDPELYFTYIDSTYRRIYFLGRNTSGLLVYDIDTDTTSTVVFGINGAFNRLTLLVTNNRIYCSNKLPVNSIVIIDRASLSIINTKAISSIPNNTRFTSGGGGYSLNSVGSKIYVVAGSGSAVSSVGVYDADLNTNTTNITLPSTAFFDFSRYWQSGFYDDTSDQFYVSDYGSSRRYVIDASTDTLIDNQQAFNKQGKTYSTCNWGLNPVTNELYCGVRFVNNAFDSSPVIRTYKVDRVTHAFLDMYEDVLIENNTLITGTDKAIGLSAGLNFWSVPNTGYNTDGIINFFDMSSGTDNTGMKIVTTLQEVDANNGDAPTGNTKPNDLGDPDYITPYEDLTDCPLVTSIACPINAVITFTNSLDTVEYEFSLPNSVINNPAIDKIEVQGYNTVTLAVEGATQTFNAPFTNYFSGTLTGLTGTGYNVQVRYVTNPSTIIQTCQIS